MTKLDLHMGRREWALLLTLSILWAGSFFFIKILVAELPPFTLVLGRVGLAALVLNHVLFARRSPMPAEPRLWAGSPCWDCSTTSFRSR